MPLGVPLTGKPPHTRAERWRVLRRVQAHAANCASGDASLAALRGAVQRVARVEADERLVLLLSDANFARHGITAHALAQAMALPNALAPASRAGGEADGLAEAPPSAAERLAFALARAANVRCRCLFLAQFDDAQRLQAALPRDAVHVVHSTDELPRAIALSLASSGATQSKL